MQLVANTEQETEEMTLDQFFFHWQIVHDYKRARLDEKRRKLINERMRDGYSLQDLADAVSGCFLSTFHMGDNDRGKRYNDLGLIIRDAAHVDNFISLYDELQTRFAAMQVKKSQVVEIAEATNAESARARLDLMRRLLK